MATQHLRVVVFQEEGAWVAQCLEFDIGAQAPDFKTLLRRFDLTMKVELEESIRRSGIPFAGIDPAPPYLQAMWEQDSPKPRMSGAVQVGGSRPARAEYELAMCA
jgi:hypothetical protein